MTASRERSDDGTIPPEPAFPGAVRESGAPPHVEDGRESRTSSHVKAVRESGVDRKSVV